MKDYKAKRGSSMQPQYLRGVSSAARVDGAALWRFESLLEHSGDIAGIRGAVMNLSGGQSPLLSAMFARFRVFTVPCDSLLVHGVKELI